MGLLDGLLGNETEIEAGEVQRGYAQLLAPGERVERAYQIIRDLIHRFSRKVSIYQVQSVLAAHLIG